MKYLFISFRNSRVDSNASVSLDPLEERLHPGEGRVHPDLAAEAGAEAGDADLSVLAVLVEILQGATGVTIAGRDSVLAGDTDVVLVDVEGELQGAGQVGDGVHSGVPQHRTDAVRLVSGLPPATDLHVQVVPGAVPLRVGGQADGSDPVCELDGLREMDQSNVIADAESVVVLVSEDLIGGDLQSSVLNSLPDIVSPQHHIDTARSISTMAGSHDPLVRDETSSTEPFVVDEEGGHPGTH